MQLFPSLIVLIVTSMHIQSYSLVPSEMNRFLNLIFGYDHLHFDVLMLLENRDGADLYDFDVDLSIVQNYSISFIPSNLDFFEYNINSSVNLLRISVIFFYNNFDYFLDNFNGVGNYYLIIVWPNNNESEAKIAIESKNLTESQFSINSNNFVFVNDQLWEFYWIKNEFVFNRINLIEFHKISRSNRRANFFGKTISAVAVFNDGYDEDSKFYVTNDTSIDAENYTSLIYTFESGLSVSIYRDLKFLLNFSEAAIPGHWMYINSNGTLEGSAEMLIGGIADISISQDNMRAELAQHLTFLHPTYPLNVVAFIEDLSDSLSLDRNIYLEPFNNVMWICTGTLICSIPICFILAFKIHHITTIQNFNESESETNRDELLYIQNESYIFGIAWISQQSWYYFPKHLTLQIIFITCYFSGVIFNAAYAASLVSKLSVRNQPINSFEDLFTNEYEFVVLTTSASMIEYAQEFSAYYGVPVKEQRYSEICSNVLTSKTALMYYWDSVYLIFDKCSDSVKYEHSEGNSKEPIVCDALVSFWVRKNLPSGMVLPKGSPYRDIFNIKILKIKETGLNHRYIKIYELKSQPNCQIKSKSKYHRLGLQDTYSSHLILGLGILCSLLIMCSEKIHTLWSK